MAAFEAALDDVQQKHHPGSWPVGVERTFMDGAFPEDDLDADDFDDEP